MKLAILGTLSLLLLAVPSGESHPYPYPPGYVDCVVEAPIGHSLWCTERGADCVYSTQIKAMKDCITAAG